MYEKQCSGVRVEPHGDWIEHHGRFFRCEWVVVHAVNKWSAGDMEFKFPGGEIVAVCNSCRNILRAFSVIFVDKENTESDARIISSFIKTR